MIKLTESNNIEAIVLDSTYIDQVLDLLDSRPKFSKQDTNQEIRSVYENGIRYSLENQVNRRVIGSFNNNDLEAILLQNFAPTDPMWVMSFYASKNNNIKLGKGYGPYLSACFRKAMNDAEEKGCFDFWWSVPIHYARNGPRMQMISPEWSRYEVYTDAIIAANTFPKYSVHLLAYGKVLKPHDVFIRHAVLKQEFRNIPLTK